jgi:hypothetical protein
LVTFVTKADGSKQPFDREKIVQTCQRMGANFEVASQIATKIETSIHEGISTKAILQKIFDLMREQNSAVKHVFDLREGLSLMVSKPEFEVFVRVLLLHGGFQVKPNAVLRGLCGEHEVDAIATKNGEVYIVEAKHHSTYHALTGLDESRIARAILEDLTDGYAKGITDFKVDRAIIVTNTRYSEHALQYGSCRGILQIGWDSPEGLGIREIVGKYRLYPLSCLRGVSTETRLRLVESGIVLIKQLLEQDSRYLERKLGLSRSKVTFLMEKAKHTMEMLWR